MIGADCVKEKFEAFLVAFCIRRFGLSKRCSFASLKNVINFFALQHRDFEQNILVTFVMQKQ